MASAPALPADFVTWQTGSGGGFAAARRDVADAVRAALASQPTLYAWADAQAGRDVFHGRGEAYGVALGPVRAVVRHARRGGIMRLVSEDRFLGRSPRFLREIRMAGRLAAAGIRTPAVLAGVVYPGALSWRADVATERLEGADLAALMFGATPPSGAARTAVLAAVGEAVRRLHRAGFVHPDLQLRNVLVLEGDIALLDVDTCREVPAGRGAAYRANLGRFLRSWDKWNALHDGRLTAADRRAFLAAYDPESVR